MEGDITTELASIESNMKVVLNGLHITYPISGVGRYTIELGRALESLLGDGKIFWFGKEYLGKALHHSAFEDGMPKHRILYILKRLLRKTPGKRTGIHLWRNYQFRSYVKNIKPSLYHETNYALFDFEEGPTLLTLYDLSFVRHPEWHPKDRVRYFEQYCLKQLSRVDAILTISEYSKKEIIELLRIDPQKIFITYPGVGPNFNPVGERMKDLPYPYILFVGSLEPRKNLDTLLQAYRSLPENIKKDFPLIITGAWGWSNRKKKVTQFCLKDGSSLFTDYVPQAYLPNLYRGAKLFVYPSLYEGFGLPVLEAMASGVPVISSNISALPEVVGDAGILVNPYLVEELTEAIYSVLINESLQREMKRKGLERAKIFSWERCAKETIKVYEKVLDQKAL